MRTASSTRVCTQPVAGGQPAPWHHRGCRAARGQAGAARRPAALANHPAFTIRPTAALPQVIAGGIPVVAANAASIAAIARTIPAGTTRLAATPSQAVAPAATTLLRAATPHARAATPRMHVETTKLLAATSQPWRGRFPMPLATRFFHRASGQPLPPRKPSRFCLVSQPNSFWRRAKSCALCSNPAAHVHRRAFPFPVAGDWQRLRSRVPPAARFGGALKRRRNCQSTASSATGFFPLRRPRHPLGSLRPPSAEVVASARARPPVALPHRLILEGELLPHSDTANHRRTP